MPTDAVRYLGFSARYQQLAVSHRLSFGLTPVREEARRPGDVLDREQGKTVTFDLVEVYTSAGALKRTFLLRGGGPVFDALHLHPERAPEAVRTWFDREILDGAKWEGHRKDGKFTASAPSAKSPGGCEVLVSPLTEVESFGIWSASVSLKTAAGQVPLLAPSEVRAAPVAQAFWPPARSPVLVLIVKQPRSVPVVGDFDEDELVVKGGPDVAACR